MSRIIYPINNKLYTAEDVEIINSPRTSGVYSVLDFDLSLSGNVLTVGKGLAWIKNADFKGKAVAFTEPETITLDSADSTLDRYDVVAVRYDATKKEPELVVIKGTASENPVIPKRNTESYLYELFLYSILRKAGESTASFENVTDLRENKNYCGIMEDSVTSAVAPVYETLFEYKSGENSVLKVGDTVDFDYSKYQFFIATIDGAFSENDIILTPTEDKTGQNKFTCLIGSNVISILTGSSQTTFYLRAQIKINEGSATGHTIQIVQTSNTADFNLENIDNSYITKLVGVTKQPKGYVAVDDVYNPESHNAQSGEAVKQAIDEMLENNAETTDNKVSAIDENSTDEQYPSAKAVYDFVKGKDGVETTYIKDITDTLEITQGIYSKLTGNFQPTAPSSQGTPLFEVKAGEKYYITGCYGYAAALIAAFDENQTYLADYSVFSDENANIVADDYEYIVPEGVAYIGCSTRAAGSGTSQRNLIVKKEVTEFVETPEVDEETDDKLRERLNADKQAEAIENYIIPEYEYHLHSVEALKKQILQLQSYIAKFHEPTILDSGVCGENLTWALYSDGLLKISGTGRSYDYCKGLLIGKTREEIETGVANGTYPEYYGFQEGKTYDDANSQYVAPWYRYRDDNDWSYMPESTYNEENPNGWKYNRIEIDKGITYLGDWLFYRVAGPTELVIPDTVTELGEWAIRYSPTLKCIYIPDSVTTVGYRGCSRNEVATAIRTPNNLSSIGDYGFAQNLAVKYLSIQGDVQTMGENICTGNTELEYIRFEGVTEIGKGTCQSCSSLKKIDLPDTLVAIRDIAFPNCKMLETIKIPALVNTIEESAFAGCTALKTVYIDSPIVAKGLNALGDYGYLIANAKYIYVKSDIEEVGDYLTTKCTKSGDLEGYVLYLVN